MAAISIESFPISLPTTTNEVRIEAPPVENQYGDIIFFSKEIELAFPVGTARRAHYHEVILTLSVIAISAIGLRIWLKEGVFMHYLPLYVALTPLFYWIIKIFYAFLIAKFAYPTAIVCYHKGSHKNKVTTPVKNGEGFLHAAINAIKNKRIG